MAGAEASRPGLWHAGTADARRPFPGSPVWQRSSFGCYDVHVGIHGAMTGREGLRVSTEGTDVVHTPAPSPVYELEELLRPIAATIARVIEEDF